jgi:hypothetical protein
MQNQNYWCVCGEGGELSWARAQAKAPGAADLAYDTGDSVRDTPVPVLGIHQAL